MAVERQEQAPPNELSDSYIENWLGWTADMIEEVAACYEKTRH